MALMRRWSTRGDASNPAASRSATQRDPASFLASEAGEPFEHEGQGLQAEKIGDLLRYAIVPVLIL